MFQGCTEKTARAYQDECTNTNQIPSEVGLAREAWVADLQLAHIVVQEVCVKEQLNVTTVDEEARYGTPDLGWECLEDVEHVQRMEEVEPVE